MAHGKKIEIFVPDPETNVITSIKLMGWSGSGIKIARDEIRNCQDYGITSPGVYLLFCEENDGEKGVYIGESTNVQKRLLQHIKDYDNDVEKFFWGSAVVFVSTDMHKTLIQYVEHRLVEIADECRQYKADKKHISCSYKSR